MRKAPATSDPPAVTVVDVSDPTEVNSGVELLDLDAVQLQSMPLHVCRVMVRLVSTVVAFHSTNVRVRTRTSVRKGFLGYVTFGPPTRGTCRRCRPATKQAISRASIGAWPAPAGSRCTPASALRPAGARSSSGCAAT